MPDSPTHPPPPTGRLAPSPTGAQHVGNARTYLAAWLSARSRGGFVRLRIEDIDSPRVKPGAADQVADDLRWLGLDWDGDVVTQTTRLPLYEAALEVLKSRELVYPCTCTRSDVAAAASAPHGAEPLYPGTCAHRMAADAEKLAAEGRPFAWRFRVTDSPPFADRYAGEQRIDLREHGGDFVVWKSAGTPAYQLAVVVDDADTGVTEVVRGDDLIPSTPRQLLLYRALGLIPDRVDPLPFPPTQRSAVPNADLPLRGGGHAFTSPPEGEVAAELCEAAGGGDSNGSTRLGITPPSFAHIPLVVGEDGRRLAKRHGDTRLAALRDAGVRPEALVGLLAWSCGWQAKPEPVTSRELLPAFRLESIPPVPFVLTAGLLRGIGYG